MARTVTLSTADLEAVLDAASSLREVVPADSAVRDVLEALSHLVECDQLFWTWIDVTSAVKIAEVGYPQLPLPVPVDQWTVHRDEHPICSGRNDPVTAISDVLTPREFHQTWLYHECFRPAGLEHEIGVNLSHTHGQVSDLILSRTAGCDFDDRDHLVLQLLQPHLDRAFRGLVRPAPSLTDRERQVLLLVREGLTNTQVARALGVRDSTVIKHLANVYARTGSHSRTQALQACADVLDGGHASRHQ